MKRAYALLLLRGAAMVGVSWYLSRRHREPPEYATLLPFPPVYQGGA